MAILDFHMREARNFKNKTHKSISHLKNIYMLDQRLYYYGIPTGTIALWGTHVLRILTVTYTSKYCDNSIFGCAY